LGKPAVGFSVSVATMDKFKPGEDQTLPRYSSFTTQCITTEWTIVKRTAME